jgi:hypothetical protein
MIEYFRKHFGNDVGAYLRAYDSDRYPPWMKRKRQGMLQAIAHPDFSRDIGLLHVCSQSSIQANYMKLLGYFVRNYGIDGEVVETWLRFLTSSRMELMEEHVQLAPPLLFNDKDKVAWPSDNPKQEYQNMMNDPFTQDAYVNLRIGRSSTKKDVLWVIEHTWESEIQPRLHQINPSKDIRVKPQFLRNSTIYSLHKQGKSDIEIAKYIEEYYPNRETKNGKMIAFNEFDVRKAIKDFTTEHPNWFSEAYDDYLKASVVRKHKRTVELLFVSEPEPKFRLR